MRWRAVAQRTREGCDKRVDSLAGGRGQLNWQKKRKRAAKHERQHSATEASHHVMAQHGAPATAELAGCFLLTGRRATAGHAIGRAEGE
jgi:hypothetical protein